MATNQTSNYKLNQWEPEDQVLRVEFNDDNDKIDKALKALADKDLELAQTLAGQAAAIAKLGNCSIERFTYQGTGAQKATIRFNNPPTMFMVIGGDNVLIGSKFSNKGTAISYDQGSLSTYVGTCNITWKNNNATVDGSNTDGQTYQVFCLSAK